MTGIVLVLGASGLFGSHAARAFADAGWQVRRYSRGTDMTRAAQGVDVIVNGLNPPMYHNWAQLIPQITAQVIAAGLASGACVIVPGNVYPYGAQLGPWGPDTPHRPVARKGHIRAAMETQYQAATRRGLRVILLRGGDYLAADYKGTAMNSLNLRTAAKGVITLGGAADVPRAYACLPDMARAAVALADLRASLPAFADLPFAGLTFSMQQWRAEMTAQSGRAFRFTAFPWWVMRLLSPFWELARELPEMRYLYDTPHRMDPGPLDAILPEFALTPLAQVVAEHLSALAIDGSGQRNLDPNRAVT